MMKLSIISLFCLFSLSLTAKDLQTSSYKNLDYKETKNESQSKYYRINNIEGYLSKLRENIQVIDQDQNSKNSQSLELLYSKIKDINTKLINIEQDIKVIKEELKLNKQGSKK